jgi:hypothetical protein
MSHKLLEILILLALAVPLASLVFGKLALEWRYYQRKLRKRRRKLPL